MHRSLRRDGAHGCAGARRARAGCAGPGGRGAAARASRPLEDLRAEPVQFPEVLPVAVNAPASGLQMAQLPWAAQRLPGGGIAAGPCRAKVPASRCAARCTAARAPGCPGGQEQTAAVATALTLATSGRSSSQVFVTVECPRYISSLSACRAGVPARRPWARFPPRSPSDRRARCGAGTISSPGSPATPSSFRHQAVPPQKMPSPRGNRGRMFTRSLRTGSDVYPKPIQMHGRNAKRFLLAHPCRDAKKMNQEPTFLPARIGFPVGSGRALDGLIRPRRHLLHVVVVDLVVKLLK